MRLLSLATLLLAACGGADEASRQAAKAAASSDARPAVAPVPPPPPDESPAALEPGDVKWLAAHQSASGLWEAAEWDRWRMGERVEGERLPGRGSPSLNVAVTSLALLAYAGAGYTPDATDHLGAVVAWGLHALRESQDADGAFGDPKDAMWPVNQGLAILALTEHAKMRADPRLVDAVRRGVAKYHKSRAVEPARWTSDRAFGGLPPFAWIALASDEAAGSPTSTMRREAPSNTGLEDDPALARDRTDVASWILLPEAQRTLAKVGAALALGAGEGEAWRRLPTVVAAAGWLADHPPVWDPTGQGVDAMGWWLATRGLFAAGGENFKRWEAAMKPAIVETQRKDGGFCDFKGSWDPIGVGAEEGGRLFMTLTCALGTEIWYRYDKVVGVDEATTSTKPAEQPPPPKPPRVDPTPPRRRYAPCR